MVTELPQDHDIVEVDEPTQPFSRVALDRLGQKLSAEESGRVASKPMTRPEIDTSEFTSDSRPQRAVEIVPNAEPGAVAVQHSGEHKSGEWFELDGRWARVSLKALEHIGFGGAPPGMVGSVDGSFVHGSINCLPDTSISPLRQRGGWLWAVLLGSSALLAHAAWGVTHNASERGVRAEQGGDPVEFVADSGEQPRSSGQTIAAPVPVVVPGADAAGLEDEALEASAPTPDPPNAKKHRNHSRNDAQTQDCAKHRNLAKLARREGEWARLEKLSQRHSCWSPTEKAKVLQLRALFELGRFRKCIQLGAKGSSEDIKTWANNCQRALD